MVEIIKLPEDVFDFLVEKWCKKYDRQNLNTRSCNEQVMSTYCPWGRFYTFDKKAKKYVAFANEAGYGNVEDFKTEKSCIDYLKSQETGEPFREQEESRRKRK